MMSYYGDILIHKRMGDFISQKYECGGRTQIKAHIKDGLLNEGDV